MPETSCLETRKAFLLSFCTSFRSSLLWSLGPGLVYILCASSIYSINSDNSISSMRETTRMGPVASSGAESRSICKRLRDVKHGAGSKAF